MKKVLSLLVALLMVFSLAACGQPAEDGSSGSDTSSLSSVSGGNGPVAEEVNGVTVPAFTVSVNGKAITEADMADYPIYSVQATSINSAETESTVTYVGFAIKDVLAAAGLSESYVWIEAAADDGYTVPFSDKALIEADTTLLAVTKDGAAFETAPWFAPCTDTTTGNYLKGCVSILVNTSEGKPDGVDHGVIPTDGGSDDSTVGSLPGILDRTDKVEFAAFSFLVNGEEVTNETLDGLSIYKIDATTVNSAGESSVSGYTGYKLADVLEVCGITDAKSVTAVANDGYENELVGDLISSDYTLISIEKDKELGEDGTVWLAPCSETSSKSFSKLVVEIKAE